MYEYIYVYTYVNITRVSTKVNVEHKKLLKITFHFYVDFSLTSNYCFEHCAYIAKDAKNTNENFVNEYSSPFRVFQIIS